MFDDNLGKLKLDRSIKKYFSAQKSSNIAIIQPSSLKVNLKLATVIT